MTRRLKFDSDVPGLHEMMELLGDTCGEDEAAELERALIPEDETEGMRERRIERANRHFVKMLNQIMGWDVSEEWVMARHEVQAMRRGFSAEDEQVGEKRMHRRKKPPVLQSSRKRSKSRSCSWGGRPVWKTMEGRFH